MEPPYDELYRSQISTWDSVPEEDVHTLFYHGGGEEVKVDLIRNDHKSTSTLLQTTDNNFYFYMAGKFRTALRYALMSKPDLIFRTNSSSMVNKKRLKEFAATLPTEKLYAGWTMKDTNDDGGDCVSGAGIFLSRDTAQILLDQLDPTIEKEEDVLCSRVLRKNGIVAIDDKSRFDYTGQDFSAIMPIMLSTKYHIRFKTDDRRQDAANMRLVHQKIITNGS